MTACIQPHRPYHCHFNPIHYTSHHFTSHHFTTTSLSLSRPSSATTFTRGRSPRMWQLFISIMQPLSSSTLSRVVRTYTTLRRATSSGVLAARRTRSTGPAGPTSRAMSPRSHRASTPLPATRTTRIPQLQVLASRRPGCRVKRHRLSIRAPATTQNTGPPSARSPPFDHR